MLQRWTEVNDLSANQHLGGPMMVLAIPESSRPSDLEKNK